MSYITPSPEIASTRRRRLLINGKSGVRKTTAILTFPKPIAILNYPGELGHDTIPDRDPDVLKLVWAEDTTKAQDAGKVLKGIEDKALELIASGKYKTIFLEGLHHFANYAMDYVTDGAFLKGADFEAKAYGPGYRVVYDHIIRLSNTNIPVVGWTCWAATKNERKRRPGEKEEDVPKKLYSALPGQLAHDIKGRFSVTLYQSLKLRKDKGGMPAKNERGEPLYDAVWQTREQGDIMCAQLKGDPRVVPLIPTYIPADYTVFEQEWSKAEEAARVGK